MSNMMRLSSTGERVAAVYGALFFAFGIYLPFYPLLLADRGMDDTEIAILIAVPMALRAVLGSPLGVLADRIGDRRRVLMLYSLIAAVAFTAFATSTSFAALLVVSIFTSLFSYALVPVSDALATAVVRLGLGDYGRMRVWGSISFVLANVLGGAIIASLSSKGLFWMLLIAFWGAAAILAIVAPDVGVLSKDMPADSETPYATAPMTTSFLRDGVLMAGLIACALIQASHAMVYSFSSLYWADLGYTPTMIGAFWATGVIAEIAMFFVSGRLFGRCGPGQMLVLSGSAAAARWLMFPLMTNASGFIALQALHSLTFACSHLAVMRLIVTRVPNRSAATVQGLYSTVGALTMSAATLASGPLYRTFGGSGFQIMSAIAIAGALTAMFWVGLRRQTAFDPGPNM